MFEGIFADLEAVLDDPGPFVRFVIIWGGGALILMAGAWILLPQILRAFLGSLDRVFPGGFERLHEDYGARLVQAALAIILIGTLEIIGAYVLGNDSVTRGALAATGRWIVDTAIGSAVLVVLIVIGGLIAMRVVSFSVPRLVESHMRGRGQAAALEETQKNIDTLTNVLSGAGRGVIALLMALLILSQIGVDLAPLLVAAGALAVGVGFAVQNLIRDVLGGIFITLENQYRVGDVVRIAGIGGLVEDINLRRTVLRDLDYRQHTIPNGAITTTTNFTKDKSRVNINIAVAYKTDLEHAIEVLNRIGQELADDEEWGPIILDPIQVLRVDNFGDSGIEIKVLGEVLPIRQWDVAGQYRLRVKSAFDADGIEIPFPHRTLYLGDATPETLAIRGLIMEAQQAGARVGADAADAEQPSTAPAAEQPRQQ